MYILNKQVFKINSRERISGSDTHFLYKLDLDTTKQYDSVCLLSASIPKSYYLIPDGRNTFTLDEGTQATVTIPAGNYSARSFATKLTSLLNATSPTGLVYSVTISDSPSTGKFVFTASSGNPSFIFGEFLYEQMGFDKNSTNTFSGSSLTSTNVINMQLEDTLAIHSDIVATNRNDILQTIYSNNSTDLSRITYECSDVQARSRIMKGNGNNAFSFSVTDEDGVEMNTNGLNVILEILVYKEDTSMREFVKLMAQKIVREEEKS
jgi:hypothetical protein